MTRLRKKSSRHAKNLGGRRTGQGEHSDRRQAPCPLPRLCDLYLNDIDQLAMVFLPLYWGNPKDCIWFKMQTGMAPER
jgi:hypothetical protein